MKKIFFGLLICFVILLIISACIYYFRQKPFNKYINVSISNNTTIPIDNVSITLNTASGFIDTMDNISISPNESKLYSFPIGSDVTGFKTIIRINDKEYFEQERSFIDINRYSYTSIIDLSETAETFLIKTSLNATENNTTPLLYFKDSKENIANNITNIEIYK